MKTFLVAVLTVFTLAVIMWGCERSAPISTEQSTSLAREPHGEGLDALSDSVVTLAGFTVRFTQRVYDNTNTTFYYTVTGPAQTQLHVRIGFPTTNCAAYPISWLPANGTTSNNDCCINPGLEWHPSTSSTTFNFSYTFAGNIPLGVVQTSVRSTGTPALGSIYGPGIPTYEISGTIFQDADRDTFLDGNESGIVNVRVYLMQSGVPIDNTVSNALGAYIFPAVFCGTYTIQVDTTSLTGTQTTYFTPTSSITRQVTVGPNSTGNNFGFETNTTKFKADLQSGALPTTGFKAQFWKKQVAAALRNGNATYSRTSILNFISAMNGSGYALPDPFVFVGNDDAKLNFALEILSRPIRTPSDELARELLALEFNQAAQKGIDLSTQLVLIGWAESLLGPLSTRPVGIREGGGIDSPQGDVEDATEIIILINKSTGGGAVGE